MEPVSKVYALGLYLACLLLFGILALGISLVAIPQFVWLVVALYLIMGCLLNKLVLEKIIDWHTVFQTLYSRGSARKIACLLWPIKYPLIFLRVFA